MSSEFDTMAHKTCNIQLVSWMSESFLLQLVRHLVSDAVQFECLKRWMFSSLDTTHSPASNITTQYDEGLLWRRTCNTSRHFSFDGWRNFFTTRLAKFLFGLDSLLEPSTTVTNADIVAMVTVWTWTTLAFTDVESPIAPIVITSTKEIETMIRTSHTEEHTQILAAVIHIQTNLMSWGTAQQWGGGGDTPLDKLYRYVLPRRVWFLSHFGLKWVIDFNPVGLKAWKWVWILQTRSYLESRSEEGYWKITYLGLKKGKGLEDRAVQPHQMFWEVLQPSPSYRELFFQLLDIVSCYCDQYLHKNKM